MKENVSDLKRENKTLNRQAKTFEKQIVDLKKDKNTEVNNNKQVLSSPSAPASSDSTILATPSCPPLSLPGPSPATSAPDPTLTSTKDHHAFSQSPCGEEADIFKEAFTEFRVAQTNSFETLLKQQKAREDWFKKTDEG